MRSLIFISVFCALIVTGGTVIGDTQQDPSKNDFIDGLKPSPKNKKTRGLVMVPSSKSNQSEMPASELETQQMPGEKQNIETETEFIPVSSPQISVNLTFGFNSAELTVVTKATLDNLGQAMQDPQLKPYRFIIEGHTDSKGGAAFNWELSLRRAAALKRYLMETHQVSPDRMKVKGKGEAEPIYPENPEASENRRVVIINSGIGS
jgi:outer membrane protein OmpA-like peptidoglycan-associated protein